MIGGVGNDTYVVDKRGDTVTETAGGGTDTVQQLVSLHARRQRREPDPDRQRQHQRHRQHARQHPHRQRRQQRARRRRRRRHHDRRRRQRHLRRRQRRRHGDRARGATAPTPSQLGITYTLGANVENLTLTGSRATSTAPATRSPTSSLGNAGTNCLDGGAGDDTMTAAPRWARRRFGG